MKAKIHPNYEDVIIRCVSCGTQFVTRSTRLDLQKGEFEGRTLPSITLDICSKCHPFYTGRQTIVDTAGRVEKFLRRYGRVAPAETKSK